MSLNDWILALHLLSAFALVGSIVLFWALVVAMRDIDTVSETIGYAKVANVGNKVVIAGVVGTLVFGIWLSFSKDGYDPWNGWIAAAIVLWVIGSATGARAGTEYMKALTRAEELQSSGQEGPAGELRALNRSPSGLLMHTISSIAVLLILIDMIWKPGA